MTQKKEPVVALLTERGKTHGEYGVDARYAIALLLTVEQGFTPRHTATMRHSIIMICFKLARILAGDPDFADHWKDIAGYATLVAERCSK